MRKYSRLFSLVLLVSLLFPGGSRQVSAAPGDISGYEASLLPNSDVYEINLDGQGNLWISDYSANAIWKVNPSTSEYTRYDGIQTPSDARTDTLGNIWWADFDNAKLGMIAAGTTQAVTWDLPVATGSPYGVFVVSNGIAWVSDATEPYLFRFNPAQNNELCTYTLPNKGALSYLAGSDGAMWTVDDTNARLYRVEINADPATFTYWDLPAGSVPEAIASAPGNGVMWVDGGSIVRFDPTTNIATRYAAPSNPILGYIAAVNDRILFNQQFPFAGFGWLNPAFTTGFGQQLQPAALSLHPQCRTAGGGTALPVTPATGTLLWKPSSYAATRTGNDWTIFEISSPDSFPTGIAYTQGRIWMADTIVRHTLLSIPYNPVLELTKQGEWLDGNHNGKVDAGEQIHYTFTVHNAGNLPLNNVTVSDPKISVHGGPVTLDVGASDSTTFSGDYTITAEDIAAGSVENQAAADSDEGWPVTSSVVVVPLPEVPPEWSIYLPVTIRAPQ